MIEVDSAEEALHQESQQGIREGLRAQEDPRGAPQECGPGTAEYQVAHRLQEQADRD